MITLRPVEEVGYDAASAYTDRSTVWPQLPAETQAKWRQAARHVLENPHCTAADLIAISGNTPPATTNPLYWRLCDSLEAFIRAVRAYPTSA